MLSQQEYVPVISKSNVNYILAVFSGTSISQALAADDSTDQLTVVIPEGTSSGEMSKFGGRRSLFITSWLSTGKEHCCVSRLIALGYCNLKLTQNKSNQM